MCRRPTAWTPAGRLVGPWTQPEEPEIAVRARTDAIRYHVAAYVIPYVVVGVGLVLTVLHLRAGRADVRGASRLVAEFGVVHAGLALSWVHPVGGGEDYLQVYGAVARVLINGVQMAVVYIALEPFVRRRWPGRLIGWQRVLTWRVFDPQVGREVAFGTATGAVVSVMVWGTLAIPLPGLTPELPNPDMVSAGFPVQLLVAAALASVDGSLVILFVAFLLARTLRTPWLWWPALVAFALAMFVLTPSTNPWLFVPLGAAGVAIALTVLLRVGLLASIALFFSALVLVNFPITYDLRAWYAGASAVGLIGVAVPAVYGLVVSVGGWRGLVRPPTDVH